MINTRGSRDEIFGEIRSRIHNEDSIPWRVLEELSMRGDYLEVIKPYLSSFDAYWEKKPVIRVWSMEELERRVSIAPFRRYEFYADYRARIERLDFSQEAYSCVERLAIFRMPLKDEGMIALAASPYMSNLKYLEIRYSEIGDEGVIALAESPNMQKLTHLKMAWRKLIEGRSVKELLTSPYMSNLTYLEVPGHLWSNTFTREISECKMIPKLDILKFGAQDGSSPLLKKELIRILRENPQLKNTEISYSRMDYW